MSAKYVLFAVIKFSKLYLRQLDYLLNLLVV